MAARASARVRVRQDAGPRARRAGALPRSHQVTPRPSPTSDERHNELLGRTVSLIGPELHGTFRFRREILEARLRSDRSAWAVELVADGWWRLWLWSRGGRRDEAAVVGLQKAADDSSWGVLQCAITCTLPTSLAMIVRGYAADCDENAAGLRWRADEGFGTVGESAIEGMA